MQVYQEIDMGMQQDPLSKMRYPVRDNYDKALTLLMTAKLSFIPGITCKDADLNQLVLKFKAKQESLRQTCFDVVLVISKISKLLNDYYVMNEERRYTITEG